MAFPVVGALNGGSSGANTTSHTCNLPADITAGQLLLLFFVNDGTATASATDWFELFTSLGGSDAVRLTVLWKIADGAEGATVTVTTTASEGSAHASYRITGFDSGTAREFGTAAAGASTAPDPPSLDPSGWATEDTLWIAVAGWDGSPGSALTSYPTSYDDNQRFSRWTAANGCSVAVATRALAASSEDPGAFTISSEQWVANTIAVRPTGGGGGGFIDNTSPILRHIIGSAA